MFVWYYEVVLLQRSGVHFRLNIILVLNIQTLDTSSVSFFITMSWHYHWVRYNYRVSYDWSWNLLLCLSTAVSKSGFMYWLHRGEGTSSDSVFSKGRSLDEHLLQTSTNNSTRVYVFSPTLQAPFSSLLPKRSACSPWEVPLQGLHTRQDQKTFNHSQFCGLFQCHTHLGSCSCLFARSTQILVDIGEFSPKHQDANTLDIH